MVESANSKENLLAARAAVRSWFFISHPGTEHYIPEYMNSAWDLHLAAMHVHTHNTYHTPFELVTVEHTPVVHTNL